MCEKCTFVLSQLSDILDFMVKIRIVISWWCDFRWFGLERLQEKDIHMRKIRESFWIKKNKDTEPKWAQQEWWDWGQDRGVL